MFSRDFKERTEEDVVLSGVSTEIFKAILLYVYRGQVVIDSSNIYRLLQASDYLGLPDIGDRCFEFVQENSISIDNTFNMFTFTCANKKNKIVEILCVDIVEQFRIFSRSSKFLESLVDDLDLIVNHWMSSSSQDDELFFSAVVRWVFHHPENRFQHIKRFIKLFQFENFKSQYVGFMFRQVLMIPEYNSAALSRIFKASTCYDDVPQLPRKTLKLCETALHVYVKDEPENLVRIFSIDSHEQCTLAGRIPCTSTNHWIRTLVLNDSYLYSFRSEVYESPNQLFHVQRSVDMVLFKGICWASQQNNIYVYNQKLSERRPLRKFILDCIL